MRDAKYRVGDEVYYLVNAQEKKVKIAHVSLLFRKHEGYESRNYIYTTDDGVKHYQKELFDNHEELLKHLQLIISEFAKFLERDQKDTFAHFSILLWGFSLYENSPLRMQK